MNNPEGLPQEENEQTPEEILDALELAFNEKRRAELTVLEPSGELKTNTVFVESLEGDILYLSASESSPVLSINLNQVKKVK